MKQKAMFLDLDGTLIEDTWYNTKDIKIRQSTLDIIKGLKSTHILIIVSNQSGINRGICSEEKFYENMFDVMFKLTEQGIYIDEVYYCPHSPEENCNCRKPKPGMLELAKKKYNLDLIGCVFIGDKECDEKAAENVGCKFIKV